MQAVRIIDDQSTIGTGIVRPKSQHDDTGSLCTSCDHFVQRIGADEGCVREQNEHRPHRKVDEQAARRFNGVSRTELFGLKNEVVRRSGRFYIRHFRPSHNDDPLRIDSCRRVENVAQQRPTCDWMQNLRTRGFHPRPFTRRQNDDHDLSVIHS